MEILFCMGWQEIVKPVKLLRNHVNENITFLMLTFQGLI